jgi:cytochrome c oxidase assembly protein subunit 15
VGVLVAARADGRRLTVAGGLLVLAVLLQISLGVATVHFGVPLSVATLHNAGAALLVMSMVWLLRALWPAAGAPDSAIGMLPLHRVDHSR